jgi:hypothetical protein
MTRPGLAVVAGVALLIATAGQGVPMLNSAPHSRASNIAPLSPDGIADEAERAAVRFTEQLLSCSRRRPARTRRPCGQLHDLETATRRVDTSRFVVLLTATLLPDARPLPAHRTQGPRHDPSAVPLALRLMLTRSDRGWLVTGAAP